MATATKGLAFSASDVSGQNLANVTGVPPDATVGEVLRGLLSRMNLPQADADGSPLTYHVRLEREGRHLHESECVGDALRADDRVVLQPTVTAGGRL